MTAPVSFARRGRPSDRGLAESLQAARETNADLRAELRARHAEAVEFAETVRAKASRIFIAGQADRPDIAAHESAQLVELATRALRRNAAA